MPDVYIGSNSGCEAFICDRNQIAAFYSALFRYADPKILDHMAGR
jgi:hypothetical protein